MLDTPRRTAARRLRDSPGSKGEAGAVPAQQDNGRGDPEAQPEDRHDTEDNVHIEHSDRRLPKICYTDDEFRRAASRVPTRREDIESAQMIWSRYLSQNERIDTALVENWKGDADSILIFTGLFAATVSAFIVESYKGLKPDSGDVAVALLSQIHAFNLDGIRPTPSSFHASANNIWVNVLWFCSLILSLTCALGATLVQQWVRVYTQATQNQKSSALERGRSRVFMFNGVTRFYMPSVIQGMPLLLHSSVFLFFIGLVVFLRPLHAIVANIVLSLVSIAGTAYAFFTVLPIVVTDSPYRTPFSPILWRSLLPASILASKAIDQLRRGRRAGSVWFSIVSAANRWKLPARFRKSMDAHHADTRLYRSADAMDFDVLADALGVFSDGITDGLPLDHTEILDSTSAFLRQHSPETEDKILMESHFLEPRFGNLVSRMIYIPHSYTGKPGEPAFFRLLWELSTRYSYPDSSRLPQISPLKSFLAQIVLHADAVEFEDLLGKELIASPDRIVTIVAVCLRAWSSYRRWLRSRGNSYPLPGHYRDVVDLLYELLPYYGEDGNIHNLICPIIRAYADHLQQGPVRSGPRFISRPLRRRFMAAWDEIQGLSFKTTGTAARQRIFLSPMSMKAPVQVPRKRGAVVLSPSGAHYRELLECLRPFHSLLPPLIDAPQPPPPMESPGSSISEIYSSRVPSPIWPPVAGLYSIWQPHGEPAYMYSPTPTPQPSPRIQARAHELASIDSPDHEDVAIGVTDLVAGLLAFAGPDSHSAGEDGEDDGGTVTQRIGVFGEQGGETYPYPV